MATDPNEKIEGLERPNTPPMPLPGTGTDLGGADRQPAHVVKLYMSQCVEGGWVQDTADGRTIDVDTTFQYVVNLEFESPEKAKAFMARDDIDQISGTMAKTMESMAQETLGLEIQRDFLPESYPDGQIPKDVHNGFTPNTIMDMNIVATDFIGVMRATYPDLGLTGAAVDEGSVNQLPGCYFGIPEDKAAIPASPEEAANAGLFRNSNSLNL